jgi:hypothetical protein
VIAPGGDTVGFTEFGNGTEKTFGVFICTNGGEVGVKAVSPTKTEGDIAYLGALLYTSPGKFVGAAHGFPPDGVDEARLRPAETASFEKDCSGPRGEDRVQLLIGAERTGSGGGVIDGVVVTTGGDQELVIPLTILLCGDRMEHCEALVAPEDA